MSRETAAKGEKVMITRWRYCLNAVLKNAIKKMKLKDDKRRLIIKGKEGKDYLILGIFMQNCCAIPPSRRYQPIIAHIIKLPNHN